MTDCPFWIENGLCDRKCIEAANRSARARRVITICQPGSLSFQACQQAAEGEIKLSVPDDYCPHWNGRSCEWNGVCPYNGTLRRCRTREQARKAKYICPLARLAEEVAKVVEKVNVNIDEVK